MMAVIAKSVETVPYAESLNEDIQTKQDITHCIHNSKSLS